MVTTLHSDDPETTTPISESKIECVFPTYPSKRTFYEQRVKLFLNFSKSSSWASVVLAHVYRASSQFSFRFPGSDADLGLNRPGFCGIPTLTVFTLMVTMIFC
jgi:hypothetical protein